MTTTKVARNSIPCYCNTGKGSTSDGSVCGGQYRRREENAERGLRQMESVNVCEGQYRRREEKRRCAD